MDPTVRLRGIVGSLRSGSPDDFPPFHSVSYSESMPVSQSQQGTPLAGFHRVLPHAASSPVAPNAVSKLGPGKHAWLISAVSSP
jgi:hypothetical protein